MVTDRGPRPRHGPATCIRSRHRGDYLRVTPRHRRQRWLGWCGLLLGCAQDNDGCSTVHDCPPPCLVGEVSIEIDSDAPDGYRSPTGIPTRLPGFGTWHLDMILDEETLACSFHLGEIDCSHHALQVIDSRLVLDRSPSSMQVVVRYVDPDGQENIMVDDELDLDYALPSEVALCGNCPVAEVVVEVPVEAMLAEEGR
jgi:hypothetical protein